MTNHEDDLNPSGTTPYHAFREWGYKDPFDYNDEFGYIDGELPKSGTLANRPASPPEGSYYRATDTRVEYFYAPTDPLADGDGWVAVSGYGTADTPAPAQANFDSAGISSTQISGRVGDAVYYDPNNRGPYADGQEAFADVPEGGTFLLAEGEYNVVNEGPLHSSVSKHIRGTGTGEAGTNPSVGTVLHSDYDSGPVINFTGGSSDTPGGLIIEGVSIDQRSATTHPSIHIQDFTQTTIQDCRISGAGNIGTGIHYEGKAFFARQYRNKVAGWTDYGINVEGTGFAHEFYQTFVTSAAGTDHTALRVNTNRPVIMGGQYSAVGTGGCAIHLDAADGIKRAGGFVFEPGIERTEYPLRVGGSFARESVMAKFYAGHLGSDVVSVLDLVDSNYGRFEPLYSSAASGNLVDYGNSLENTILLSGGMLEDMTVSGTPSNRDILRVTSAPDNGQLVNFPTGDVIIYCDMNTTELTPVWHNRSGWRKPDNSAFTP